MTRFADLLGAVSTGVDTLADFDRQASVDAGVDPTRVRDWANVHEVYFGPTRWTRRQREAVTRARAGRLSIDQLVYIERRIRNIASIDVRWELRLALLGVRGGYATLRRAAARIVPSADEQPPRAGVSFTGSKKGMRRMTVTAPERDIADIEFALTRRIDPSRPVSPQLVGPFMDLVRGTGSAGAAQAVPRPLLLVPLPDHVKIQGGQGDEVVLGLSDGTTITGADYLREHHGKQLEVALFHPEEGPVNLYRTQRFANQKQRDLARATLAGCPVPGCRHGADSCEVHHITPWKHGGETNMSNLASLCRYHNRVNDDDPHRSWRGRIAMIRGTPTWISPRGHPAANARHPHGAMRSLFGRLDGGLHGQLDDRRLSKA